MRPIDHQVGTMGWTNAHEINLVKQTAIKLAKIAAALNLPVLLNSSIEENDEGARVTAVEQIISELAIDWTSPNGQKLVDILKSH